MKKYYVILIGLSLCISLCSSSCFSTRTCTRGDEMDWIMTDSFVISHFSEELRDLLSTPDSVKCYSIKYIVDKESQGYMRDIQLAVLDSKQIAILQYLLVGNPHSYKADTVKIEAPYIPIIEFEFLKDDSISASIIISISDRSWSLFNKDKRFVKNTYGDACMIERYCDYFLNLSKKNDKK